MAAGLANSGAAATARYKRYRRILAIVIDSIGVGDAPDAAQYNSDGADTLGHLTQWWLDNKGRALALPNMERLGLNLARPGKPFAGIGTPEAPAGAFGRMRIISRGNDSLDGHWEMMCLPTRFASSRRSPDSRDIPVS